MDSLGYLDTVNYITNHELHDPNVFNEKKFYIDLVDKFKHIYEATLLGAGKDPEKNMLLREMVILETKLRYSRKSISEAEISKQVYQLIKDKVEIRLDSMEAFALSRAVEFRNKTITAEQLFKETYEEGFKRGSIFSVSKISGESIFRSSTLHESLKNKNMFELYANQRKHQGQTRTDKVFSALSKMTEFTSESESKIDFDIVIAS
jgi:NTE family protein